MVRQRKCHTRMKKGLFPHLSHLAGDGTVTTARPTREKPALEEGKLQKPSKSEHFSV